MRTKSVPPPPRSSSNVDGADDPTDYAATIAWLKVTTEQLWDDATSVGASEQLVAWLVQFGEEVG